MQGVSGKFMILFILFQGFMLNFYILAFGLEIFTNLLSNVNRTMFTACTADGYGEIASVILL